VGDRVLLGNVEIGKRANGHEMAVEL